LSAGGFGSPSAPGCPPCPHDMPLAPLLRCRRSRCGPRRRPSSRLRR
jgi:hypothetical protein